MSALGAGRTRSLAEKVEVCNTCGDAGFDDCLAFCSQCNEGAEHLYCMVTVFDTFPLDWICEGCKSKQRENSKKRRLVSDGLQPVQAQKKQMQNNFASPKSIKLLHSSLNKKDSSENGTEQIATIQADKAPSSGPVGQVLPLGGSTVKKKLLVVRDQPCFPTECIAASDVNKPAPSSVIPARNAFAKESSHSETIKAVSSNGCYNDNKDIPHKDLLSVLPATCTETTHTVLNYQPAIGLAQIVKEPSCLDEPVVIQDISVVAIDMKTSGERVENEKQGLNKTGATSLAEGKQLSVEAERCNVNKTADFSPFSLAKPVTTEKEKMEVISGSGKQTKVDHHNMKKAEGFSLSPLAKPAATGKESMEVDSQTDKPVSMNKTDSKHIMSIAERNYGDADAKASIRRPIFNSQPSQVNSALVESGSMKVASGYTTNKLIFGCTTPPVCQASLVERKDLNANKGSQDCVNTSIEKPISNAQDATIDSTSLKLEPRKGTSCSETGKVVSACRNARILTAPLPETIEEDAIISSDGPIAKTQQVTVNSKATKTEYDVLVKRSRSDARKVAIRDFPIITKKVRFLGEKGEKVSNLKSKGNVVVREDTAAGQEKNGSCNKEHPESGGFLDKKTTTQQETYSPCNSLEAKEEEIAVSVLVEPPSLLSVEEKAQAQEVIHKGGAAGLHACVIEGPAERPSLFQEEEKIQPQNVQLKDEMAGSLSGSVIGSAESPFKEDTTGPQNVKQIGGVAGSSSSFIKNSILDNAALSNTKAPSNGDSLLVSPCTAKRPTSEVLPMQENSKSAVSGAGVYKIPVVHSKRVVKRDFPLLKGRIGKEVKVLSPSFKPKVVNPSEDKEQVTGNKSDADTEKVIERDVPAIAQEVFPGKLENASSSYSMGYSVGIMTTLEDDIRAASTLENKDATGLASRVSRELPTDGLSNTFGGKVALVIETAPTNSRPALKRKTNKKNLLSPPCKDGSLRKGVVISKCAKGPPCLPGEMEGVIVKGNSIEGDHVNMGGRCHILKQKGEALQDVAASSQVRTSIRERHGNATYGERESEDDDFHDRLEDAGCEPLDHRMGLRKSISAGPRRHTLPDSNWEKQDHYSRGSRHEARESSSYKTYKSHRYEAVGPSGEFCKANRQKEWKTQFLSDSDDRVSDLEHAKRECKGSQVSDGKKGWRYDPKREERFTNSRACVDSDAEDCVQHFKRPLKASEYSRHDEKFRYKPHSREEARFERETSRLETSRTNGTQSELRPYPHSKSSEYSRVHKRQIVRIQNEEFCEPDTYRENGKAFPIQGNASSYPAGPAGMPRSGHGSRLLPNQAPSTSQAQVYDDRLSQSHVPSQLHGSSLRDFSQKRRAAPDLQVMWTGCFYVSSKTGGETCYQGIEVRPSKLAHSKVFEVLLDLPVKLKMEERERGVETDTWPRAFQEAPPTSHSIGIYFFATDLECYNRWYKPLVNRLAARDFALKVKLDFAELLIFPSQILPEAEQFWDDRYFLWGIFRRNVEESNHLLRQPSCRDAGSDLESPAGNGEVIDMDVDMVGGEDAVSQQLNPPLPPGFAPPPPYRP